MTNTTNIRPDQMPTPRFGVRVSKTHPNFDLGELSFKTRLITVGEDRQITRTNDKMAKAEPVEGGEDGETKDLTPEQQEQNLNITGEIVVSLLQPRVNGDPDTINLDWFMDNMTSEDIGPLLYFLRKGEPQPENLFIDLEGEFVEAAESPNADE